MKKILTILAIMTMALTAKAVIVSDVSELKTALEANNDITLTQDIDLSSLLAISSGDNKGYLFVTYTGTLDGNGHTLKNSTHPLFRHTGSATIKNLTLDGFTVTDATCILTRTSTSSTFSHVTVRNSSLKPNDSGENAAMIAGWSSGDKFEYCTTETGCSISVKKKYVGGIAGRVADNASTFTHCTNGATIESSEKYVAGILGSSDTGGTISYCKNVGKISADEEFTAGIVGYFKNGAIDNCLNAAIVFCAYNGAGICGQAYSTSITRCINTGIIDNSNHSQCISKAGIVGSVEGDKKFVSYCMNFGTINYAVKSTAANYASGPIGGSVNNGLVYTDAHNYYSCQYNGDHISNNDEIGITYDMITSGEYAYTEKSRDNIYLYQSIDNNNGFPTNVPVQFPEAGEVYSNILCDGTQSYSNIYKSTAAHASQLDDNGICTVCGRKIIHISNADALISFANDVNNGKDYSKVTVCLDNDIDLSGKYFPVIGRYSSAPYAGTFDGQGHRIKNMSLSFAEGGIGFFGVVSGVSTIKNTIIDASCTVKSTSGAGVAGLVGKVVDDFIVKLNIENCGNEAAVTGCENVSGLLGLGYGTQDAVVNINNCYNTGAIYGESSKNCASIVGYACVHTNIRNTFNTGSIESGVHYYYAFAGTWEGIKENNKRGTFDGTIENCYTTTTWDQTPYVTKISLFQVESGDLCTRLNQNGNLFTQTIGIDNYPVPGTAGLKGDADAFWTAVSTAEELKTAIEKTDAQGNHSARIKLTNDIDLSGLSAISSGDEKGYLFTLFQGNIVGQGHTLSNSTHGMFYGINGATLEDIVLDGFKVTDQTSLIARTSKSSKYSYITVKNSSIKHTSDDMNNFGMIVGWSNYDDISYCNVESDCSVTVNRQRTGGLVGESFRGKISHCRNSATVTGDADDIGGIVGKSGDSDDGAASNIEYCVNTGTINGDDQCGGIVGYYREGTITNCVNTGTITAKDGKNHDNQGGIAGKISNAACNNSINFGPVVKCKSENSQFAIYGGKDGSWSAAGNEYYCTVQGKHFDTGIAYDDIMSGKYALSKDWLYQDIDNGTFTATAYPVPLIEAGTVYSNILCDNTLTYSNKYEGRADHETHLDADGVCTLCGLITQHITDASGLESLSTAVNSSNGRKYYNVYLDNDITLTQIVSGAYNSTHTPIGNSVTSPFKGRFDGQGHSINGMRLTSESNNIGLFGVVSGPNTVIKNVVVSSDCDISSLTSDDNTYTYGIAGIAGSVTSASGMACNVTIENCGNEAYITQGDYNVAGILGRVLDDNSTITINNCYNTSAISGNYSPSTICGNAGNNYTITNCYNGDYNDYPLYQTGSSVSAASSVTRCYSVNSSESENVSLPAGVTRISAYQLRLGNLCQQLNANLWENTGWSAWTQEISKQDAAKKAHPTFGTAGLHYARTMANQWGTICLPFAIENGDDYDFYELSDVNGDALVLTKVEGTLAAGTPAIVRRDAEATAIDVPAVVANGDYPELVEWVEEPVTGSTAKGLTLTGVFCSKSDELFSPYIHAFEAVDITSQDGYIIANNAFWDISTLASSSKVYCAPFRAYLAGTVSSGAKQLTIGFDDDVPTTVEAIISPLGELEGAAIYDLNGRKLNDLQPGINIVKFRNGTTKKIIIK